MSDLHHWHDAEAFSAQEAAALVVGIDPLDPVAPPWMAGPVLERMKVAHEIARAFVTQAMTPAEFAMQRELRNWADALVSVLFDNYPTLQKNPWPSDPNRPYELPTRFAGPDGEFQVQKFARAEIQRWLSVVDISSAYQFDRKTLNAGPFRATPAPPLEAVSASGGAELDKAGSGKPLQRTDAGMSTAILLFTKTNSGGTDNVWFYDMKADGWSLDDKRQPLLSEDKLGFQVMKDGRSPLSEADHSKNNLPDVLARWGERDDAELRRDRTDQSFCVPKGDIVGNGYDLSINRYKEVVHAVSEHLAPKEILAKLAVLEAEIQAGMKELEGMLL